MAHHLPIPKGRRHSVPLEDLLQVVAVSRQCLCVESEDDHGQVLGSVWIKSGFVLSASTGDRTGGAAVGASLGSHAATDYPVCRPPQERGPYGQPLGAVAEMVLNAAVARRTAQAAATGAV